MILRHVLTYNYFRKRLFQDPLLESLQLDYWQKGSSNMFIYFDVSLYVKTTFYLQVPVSHALSK